VKFKKDSSENFRGSIIFSFEFHRKRIVAILQIAESLL